MSSGGTVAAATAAAAAAAAAIARATKASGAIVRVEPTDFLAILSKTDRALVVMAESKFLKTSYRYLTNYKGLFFFTKSSAPLLLPSKCELVIAKKIWIP